MNGYTGGMAVEPRSGCPIGITLDIAGDRWTLLIVRDLAFGHAENFQGFSEAAEGIASNVLADRLARLQRHGIVEASTDPGDGRRRTYRLTEKGWGLAPLLLEMILWAAQHEVTDAPEAVVAAIRADRDAFLRNLRSAGADGR